MSAEGPSLRRMVVAWVSPGASAVVRSSSTGIPPSGRGPMSMPSAAQRPCGSHTSPVLQAAALSQPGTQTRSSQKWPASQSASTRHGEAAVRIRGAVKPARRAR
jgi:hypothetical protein